MLQYLDAQYGDQAHKGEWSKHWIGKGVEAFEMMVIAVRALGAAARSGVFGDNLVDSLMQFDPARCHSRECGNPRPRHVSPSLVARFRGHDTRALR